MLFRSAGPGQYGPALAMALAAMVGCTSATQREAARIGSVATSDAPRIDDCWRKAVASAPFQALRSRMGEHADSPTDAMKANPAKATPQEAELLLALQQDHLSPCRRLAIESAAKVGPSVVAILAGNYAAADENTTRLTTGRVTWGAFVIENQALITRRRAALLAVGEQMQRRLNASQQTAGDEEGAAREQADEALALWVRRQQLLLQGQKSGGPIKITRCRYQGAALHCAED